MDSVDYEDVDKLIKQVMNETEHNIVPSPPTAAVQIGDALENCFNATLFQTYVRGVVKNATTLSRAQQRAIEGDPLVYIVAVLIFYSCGIVILMINYMKKVIGTAHNLLALRPRLRERMFAPF